MYAETKASRTPDLRLSSSLALAVHALLLLLAGAAVTQSRARFTPPALQIIRLDVDLPAPEAADDTLATPSASPVQAAVPQPLVAPPRPSLAVLNEERLAPAAAPDSLAPQKDQADATAFVTSGTITKSFFSTATEGAPAGVPPATPEPAAGSGTGSNAGSSAGIEGPISLRRGMKPPYPLGARQRGEEGTVVLETTVAPDGRATAVTVVSSSRFAELDRAAVKAVERATFNPATENGRAIEAQARITIIFRLTQ
ncbi:MAG: TonB family protein [bacterium]